jgi:hypothetical protein
MRLEKEAEEKRREEMKREVKSIRVREEEFICAIYFVEFLFKVVL